jgi:hypothetical protein
VTLRAAPKSRWNNAIETYREHLELAACKSLWDAPGSTEEEGYFLEAPRWGMWPAMDWLASGLIRRIALFRTFGLAFHVSAWTSGDTWKIEIDTDPVHGAVHSRFLAAIIDPVYGLPLRLRHANCMCDALVWPRGAEKKDCWYHLGAKDGMPVELQLRFRQRTPPPRLLERLVAAGADPAWVGRALPPSSSSSTDGRN